MKYIKINSVMMLISLLVSFIFSGCREDVNYMEVGIIDMNNRITSVDKEIAQPGDIVTFTGTDLDKVYKIMLNTDNVPVDFTATSTELKMTVPALPPLGDVITINLLFSGKGLATRAIKLISPPIIFAISPAAAHVGDVVTVYGKELHLSQTVTVDGIEVPITLESDKIFTFVVPDGFAGGPVTIETATGGLSNSPGDLILGTELLVTDIDKDGTILSNYGPYSNAKGEKSTDAFPKNGIYVISIFDNASSWGANCDFSLKNMPATIGGIPIDLTKVEMVADVKASKQLTINFMVGKAHNPPGLWGKKMAVTQNWQTITVPFTALGQGYDEAPITDDPLIPFNEYTMIKWSLPAKADAGNFGETITFDNVKFIVRD